MAAAMDRETALHLLRSESVLKRRQAARFFAKLKSTDNTDELRTFLVNESDHWVRENLRTSIRQEKIVDEGASGGDDVAMDAALAEIRTRALNEVTDSFLHELSPLVAEVQRRAQADVSNFEATRTSEAINQLLDYLDAMRRLRSVTGHPDIVELDLTDLVAHLVSDASGDSHGVKIFVTRDEPLNVQGDKVFLQMAINNGLRNAIDASSPGQEILINLSTTDEDAWVAILDEGTGLPSGADNVWELGRTTKPKSQHQGIGLPIARQAMTSLNGSVSLHSREDRGTAFEVRWPLRRLT